MAGGGKQERDVVHGILDDFIDVQKRDAWDITSGHLNESKLWNPKEAHRMPWQSATKPYLRLKEPSKIPNRSDGEYNLPPINRKNMTEAVMDFMLGPVGGVGMKEKAKYTTPVSPAPELSFIDKVKQIPSDKNLIQELALPELMLPISSKHDKDKVSPPNCKYQFVTSHHALPTKLDQFNSMKEFETIFMQKKDAQERQALTGAKEVAKIERRLRKKLDELERKHIIKGVPSFYTLQAYSDCWEELIENSLTFKEVLRQIKDEYDESISLLLDAQDSQNDGLHQQLRLLSSQSSVRAEELRKAEKQVENLEVMAMKALHQNDKLKDKLKEEKEKAEALKFHTPDRNAQPARLHIDEKEKKDLEQQVQKLHQQIEQQLKVLSEREKERKENHVPIIVCQRLEQGIKETEVDIQKLLKQNEYLENNIESMEEELENLLLESEVHESDARSLWKRINTSILKDLGQR